MMQTSTVILQFFDGTRAEGRLLHSFDPRKPELSVRMDAGERPVVFRLLDLCYLLFPGTPAAERRDMRTLEEVTTRTGETFRVHIPDQEIYPSGFFGFPADRQVDWRAIFFSLPGVRRRELSERVGEILVRNGALGETELKSALAEQERLRSRRVGEILSETSNVPRQAIEDTLAAAVERPDLPKNARVGDILVAAGLVTREQVEQAVEAQEQDRRRKIGDILIERGLITENQLMAALAAKFRLPLVDLATVDPDEAALNSISSGMARKLRVLPLRRRGSRLTVATAAPTDHTLLDALQFAAGCHIELVVAYEADILAALDHYYPASDTIGSILGELSTEVVAVEEEDGAAEIQESDSQVINLVNKLLVEAHRNGISDLHFEPGTGTGPLRVRHRQDGRCQVAYMISGAFKRAVIARLKIMADLDIAERRKPQSGKILLRSGRRYMEFRLEVTPTVGGMEDAVVRVLGSARPRPLEELDFLPQQRQRFEALLEKPYGMILSVGPTGSGKTTTLHSALAVLNTPERKIWTVEDPVEITQHGLRQVPVHPRIGFSFAEALRSLLRADPDVIMVGEMRDLETARIAVQAALTGHLVFSTLHTNSAAETIIRLIDMGLDPLNFSDALLGILAQRLVRIPCENCREEYTPEEAEYRELVRLYGEEQYARDDLPRREGVGLVRAVGCEHCRRTGYRGRTAIHELLVVSDEIRSLMKSGRPVEELRAVAVRQGMRTLKMDGIAKVLAGRTDLRQVLQVCI